MLRRLLAALLLATTVSVAGAVAFLRTDFVASNLCAYAVATIEEATKAHVHVASCQVDPVKGTLVIDGLRVGDPGGQLRIDAARVFAQVEVRPLQQKLRLTQLEVDHPNVRLVLEVPPGKSKPREPGACLPEVLDRFELGRVQIRKASIDLDLRAQGVHIKVPRVDVRLKGKGEQLTLALATRTGAVALPGRNVGLLSLHVQAGVDLRGTGTLDLQRADIIGTEATAYVKGRLFDICNPRIEATANVHVDDLELAAARLLPGVLTGVKGAVQLDGLIRASADGKVDATGDLRIKGLQLEGFSPGDAKASFHVTPEKVTLSRLQVPIGKGEVTGQVELAPGLPGLPLTAEVTIRDMELAELLHKLGIVRSHVVMATSGKARVHGPLLPLALRGEVALDLSDFAILDRRFEERDRALRTLEFPRGRLTSGIAIAADKVTIDKTELSIGGSKLHVAGDFSTDFKVGLNLAAHAEGFDLGDFKDRKGRKHLGPIDWSGKATLLARVVGPYTDPTIDASAQLGQVRFLDLSLGDVAAKFHFFKLVLALSDIQGKKLQSGYTGDVRLDFNTDDIQTEAHLAVVPGSHLHDLVDLAVDLVPTLSTVHDQEDVDGLVRGTLHIRGPAARPDGYAQLEFQDVNLWGQKFATGETQLALYKGVRLVVQKLELLHSLEKDSAAFELAGTFGPEWKLEMDGRTRGFDLKDLDSASTAQLHGPLLANMKIRGVASHPLIDAGMKFWGGQAGKAELGDGDFTLRVDGKALVSHGTVGTHVFDALARLEGNFAFTSTLALRFEDLSGYFATFAKDSGLQRGRAYADVAAQGSLLKWRQATGTVNLTQLNVGFTDPQRQTSLEFANEGNGQLSFGPEGLDIKKLAIVDSKSLLQAQLKGTRARGGGLDMRLSATMDGKLLLAFAQGESTSDALIEHAAGTAYLEATVAGTDREPTMLGSLQIENGELRARGSPVVVRELNGRVSFSDKALLVEDVTARLNSGPARFSGSVRLKDFAPEYLDLQARLTEVTVKLQENLSCTLEEGSHLTLVGSPSEPTLSGSLILARMKYAEDVNLERQLLDFTRRPPTPRALAKSDTLVHFNVDVTLARGVRIENNLARADLKGEFTVTGTSRRLGLLGSVNTVHGTANFRGNEFQIEQGVLNFTDRQSIRPSFDLQALSSVKDYKVRLHAFGTPQEPRVQLTSEPALAESDLAFLLTFGFVQSNIQAGGVNAADTGTAIALEALNKVTGFSEEVRRFIPKNSILRNPTIDFTSDFSVASNRVEPMARFHSQLLTEKLDLKILQGLSTRRGRGVVAYRLTDSVTAQGQVDNEHIQIGTDFGLDLSLRWEGN